jgi:hypothetical protein
MGSTRVSSTQRARSSVDRVLASEAKGRRFDSCRARQRSWKPKQRTALRFGIEARALQGEGPAGNRIPAGRANEVGSPN